MILRIVALLSEFRRWLHWRSLRLIKRWLLGLLKSRWFIQRILVSMPYIYISEVTTWRQEWLGNLSRQARRRHELWIISLSWLTDWNSHWRLKLHWHLRLVLHRWRLELTHRGLHWHHSRLHWYHSWLHRHHSSWLVWIIVCSSGRNSHLSSTSSVVHRHLLLSRIESLRIVLRHVSSDLSSSVTTLT
jgi:hypothetical protein